VALSRTLTEHLDRIAADMQREDLALLARTAAVTTSLCTADFGVVRGHLDAVLAAYDADRHAGLALSYSMDPKALSLLFAAHAFSICGDTARAAWARDEAIAHVGSLGYEFLQPYATIFGWGSALYFGADESVLQTLDAAIMQAERLALPFWVVSGLMWKGVALFHLGRDAEADACLRPGLDTAALIGLSFVVPYLRSVHAAVLARLGRLDAALPMFEQSLAQARATGETFALPEVHRLYAEALATLDEPARQEEARRQLAAGAEIAERQGATGWILRLRSTRERWEAGVPGDGVAGQEMAAPLAR
jgi:predicted ATPase